MIVEPYITDVILVESLGLNMIGKKWGKVMLFFLKHRETGI